MRLRITFSKTGPLRYISHLDLHTLWERAARRAGLPLAYSQGFHPQPKINLASALPLGFASRCEVLDMRLNEAVDLAELPARLQAVMPAGIGIISVAAVDEAAPALQTQLTSAEYEVTLTDPVEASGLERGIAALLANTALPRERRGRAYDLRPLIEKLELLADNKLRMQLSAREGATGRPDEVLAALQLPSETAHVERTRLIFQ
jgi:radical SAM-linked protein